jgi:hypothetical protein
MGKRVTQVKVMTDTGPRPALVGYLIGTRRVSGLASAEVEAAPYHVSGGGSRRRPASGPPTAPGETEAVAASTWGVVYRPADGGD